MTSRATTFHVNLQSGGFTIGFEAFPTCTINDFRLAVLFHRAKQKHYWILQGLKSLTDDAPLPAGLSGVTVLETLMATEPSERLRAILTFAAQEQPPAIFWKLEVSNPSHEPIWIERIDLLVPGERFSLGFLEPSAPFNFYVNGWQSWSLAASFPSHQKQPRSRLGPFQVPMVINAGTPIPREAGHFASDFFTVIKPMHGHEGLVIGFLSQQQHFGTLEFKDRGAPFLRVWANGDQMRLDPGCSISSDWLVVVPFSTTDPDPLQSYLNLVATHHGISPKMESPNGWCSWYYYYTKVSAEDIRQNLRHMVARHDDLPLELLQIDDGFEAQVGDWFAFAPSFPDGVAPLAHEIRTAGLKPGLWLAPFIVHPQSRLAREHPHWLLRTPKGRPVNAGFVWNTFATALDLTVPEALDYAAEVVRTAAHKWGFPYLKLDFLYAAALPGRYHDPTRTRAQVLRQGIEALRHAAGDEVFLLGCGAPLGSALGLVDAMRIGADVSGSWAPEYLGQQWFFAPEPHMPAARNAIRNTITRAPLHRRWWINDPDCLLIRPDTKLTIEEVQTLASVIALSGGSLLLSDNLPALPEERLRIAQVLLPPIGERMQVMDLLESPYPKQLCLELNGAIGSWILLGWINWDEVNRQPVLQRSALALPEGVWLAHDFWNDTFYTWDEVGDLLLHPLKPHAVALLALYPLRGNRPAYLGSNLHISQGLEVESWQVSAGRVVCQLALPRRAQGYLNLLLPGEPQTVTLDGQSLSWQRVGNAIYRFPIAFSHRATLVVEFERSERDN